jgi:type II secretion system protein G
MKKNNFSKGFTLIELLIVITIIGILAVALLPSVLGAPARARDAARKADLNNIIAAMETYNSDNQKYPAATSASFTAVDAITGLSNYFQGGKVPKDPQGATSYQYCDLTGTASYVVASKVEIPGDGNYPSVVSGACTTFDQAKIDDCKPKKASATLDCAAFVVVK